MTTGLAVTMDDRNAAGTHSRTIASACELGLPSRNMSSSSMTTKMPIEKARGMRIDRHARASVGGGLM